MTSIMQEPLADKMVEELIIVPMNIALFHYREVCLIIIFIIFLSYFCDLHNLYH